MIILILEQSAIPKFSMIYCNRDTLSHLENDRDVIQRIDSYLNVLNRVLPVMLWDIKNLVA